MTKLSKVFASISAILFVSLVVVSIVAISKNAQITNLETTITTLKVDNEVLASRVESCQKICEAQKAATEKQQEEIDFLRDKEKTFLEKLEFLKDDPVKEKTNETKNVSRADDLLPSDLAGLLHESCKSVRGKTCSN